MDLYKRVLRQISSASEISPEIQAALKLTKQLEDMDCENRPWKQPFTPIYPVSLQPLSREEAVENIGDQMREGDGQTPAGTTQETPPAPPPASRWPWGDHHTEALGHLEAAALRFWVNHDPADITTAPKNELVEEWLQKERKVTKNLSKAIATILRLDGLRNGPR